MEKILFIGAVVLLVFGPEKVPVIARTLGNLVREFQNALHPTPEAPRPQTETHPPVKRPLKKSRGK